MNVGERLAVEAELEKVVRFRVAGRVERPSLLGGWSYEAADTKLAFEQKKNRILELYAIADGLTEPEPDDPAVVICLDEFGPLNLQPPAGR